MKSSTTKNIGKTKKSFLGLAFLLIGWVGLGEESQAQRVQDYIGGGRYGHDYDVYEINQDYSNSDCGIRLNNNDNGFFLWSKYSDAKFRITSGGAGAKGRMDNDLFELDKSGNLRIRGALSNLNGGTLNFNSQLYLNNGVKSKDWVRVEGDKGLYFQNRGGGFYMTDNTWIRTYGDKSFYHNSGIMRTDGTFQVGSGGSRFEVETDGSVGIGTNSSKIDLAIGDNDTGLQQQGDGKLAIYTNNAERLRVDNVGNVAIGKTTAGEKLDVNGNVKANKVILNIGTFPDYVFEEDYELMPLKEVEAHILANKRLPNMPSEKEVVSKGMDAGQINVLLVEKVEELTLHTIAQEKKISGQKEEIEALKLMVKALAEKID